MLCQKCGKAEAANRHTPFCRACNREFRRWLGASPRKVSDLKGTFAEPEVKGKEPWPQHPFKDDELEDEEYEAVLEHSTNL